MRIHLIAIGGAAMHNLALELAYRGHHVTGSDDVIYEPSRTRLAAKNLLPTEMGWNAERIDNSIDLVILGMHAKADNPELAQAASLGIKIQSYPEYIASFAANQKRLVIAGSHGKTTITSMVIHALQRAGKSFNYLVGAQLAGFDRMVKLDPHAEFFVIEGDEYLSSALDKKSKFLWYNPHAAVISGIAWDHINVFPSFESYLNTFKAFAASLEAGGKLFIYEHDAYVKELKEAATANTEVVTYDAFAYKNEADGVVIKSEQSVYSSSLIGKHNFENLKAASLLCGFAGISEDDFLRYSEDFDGASKRMEVLHDTARFVGIKDFAHAPSKVQATINGVKERYPNHFLLAILELHTFSSLDRAFLPHFAGSCHVADHCIVFTDEAVFKQKNRVPFTEREVKEGFKREDLSHYLDISDVIAEAKRKLLPQMVLLVMTSGNFGGVRVEDFVSECFEYVNQIQA